MTSCRAYKVNPVLCKNSISLMLLTQIVLSINKTALSYAGCQNVKVSHLKKKLYMSVFAAEMEVWKLKPP
jgi:hypothetical protein